MRSWVGWAYFRFLGSESLLSSVIALIVSLGVGFAIILFTGNSPFLAFRYMLLGSFSSWTNFGDMLATSTPLIIIALSVAVTFRAGIFNIGAQGQMYLGALAAAWAGYALYWLPGPLLILVCFLVGAAVGAFWALIPALMKIHLRSYANEVVSTLMLNYVAVLITSYLVKGPLRDPQAGSPMTYKIAASAWLPNLVAGSSATIGFIIAIGLVIVMVLLLGKTIWGKGLAFVGQKQRFAEYIGFSYTRIVLQSMVLAGMLAGVTGVILVLGIDHRFVQSLSPGYGFIGLTVALLGRLDPWGALVGGLLYGVMMNGGTIMQQHTSVPYPLVSVIQGVLVVLVTAQGLAYLLKSKRRRNVDISS